MRTVLWFPGASGVTDPDPELTRSRYEQVPGDGPLLISTVWKRALSHLVPGAARRAGRGGSR